MVGSSREGFQIGKRVPPLRVAAMELTLSRADYLQVNRSAGALVGGRGPGEAPASPGPGPGGVPAVPSGLDRPVTPTGPDHTSHISVNHHSPTELTKIYR